jgi:hypothetical protein
METLSLTTPEVIPAITTTDYKVALLLLDMDGAQISIHLRGTNGERKEFRYDGADATALMVSLNKANLTVKSLQRRILEKLTADGKMAGAVTGIPD